MRIKRGVASHKKHIKLLRSVKGYRMTKHKLVKVAHEAAFHAGQYAYSGRKHKKSDFRKLWVTHISEAVKKSELSYSTFIAKLKKANIVLDRKVLDYLLLSDPEAFQSVIDIIKTV